ncbi:MAG: GNAT family N-acetyltransferase [Marinicellaceae bacterium]
MKYSLFKSKNTKEIIHLFTQVFSASEGAEEGNSIGKLVQDLVTQTNKQDLIGCISKDEGKINACLFFSRFIVPSNQKAFLLSPVAVATEYQGQGIGQGLIDFGLDCLKNQKVSLVFTYGDPSFYSKIGFEQISEKTTKPPFPLSQPEGWLAQNLEGDSLKKMTGDSRCVEAFNDKDYW